ncbi:MAG TPA: lytic transglycosylase domain-containing protein [Solirubrobacteraceae bacterium]|nr:lytic transglycosylase domain-containing protein [Solirubrobacteraceae bacterium]
MSTEAIAPSGELAIAQRVQQLQAMIEQTRQSAVTGIVPGAATSGSVGEAQPAAFASALQAATSTGTAVPAAYTATTGAAQSTPYDALIEQVAQRHGVDPAVLHGLIQQESGFDPNAQSSAGASGLTQLMPGTASSLGVANPLDPAEAIEGGARYLGQLTTEFGGNTTDALAAYNAGPGAVKQYGGVPPYAETQSYVTKVLGYAEAYRQSHPVSTGALA